MFDPLFWGSLVLALAGDRGGSRAMSASFPTVALAAPSDGPDDHTAHRTRGATAMMMTPRLRKFALTAHVTSSVGWLGAVAGFLALAVAGLTSQDAHIVRAAYLATELITWFVIVPLGLASLLTGLVQSLGTTWGLFRHYWVLAKFLLTILATIVLLLHTQPISYIAGVAAETTLSSADLRGLRIQLVADAGAALLVLLVNTTLAVYKPGGMTRYGRRQDEQRKVLVPYTSTPRCVYVAGIIAIVLVLLFVIMHLTGGGLGRH